MRVRDLVRRWLGMGATDAAVASLSTSRAVVDARLDSVLESHADLLKARVVATARIDALSESHADLVRQFGLQQAAAIKQFTDLRAIVTQLGEKAKERPITASNMADLRRFVGDDN